MFEGPYQWAALRLLTGISVAAGMTVSESWLQAQMVTKTRGRVFGIFRVVDMSGSILAQGLIAVLDPASYVSYNIVAVFCCLCVLPLALTQKSAPPTPDSPRLRPNKAALLSPTACFGSAEPAHAPSRPPIAMVPSWVVGRGRGLAQRGARALSLP